MVTFKGDWHIFCVQSVNKPPFTAAILSDSRSALDLLSNGNSTNPLAVNANDMLRPIKESQKIDIKFFWVKAHNNILGNEKADDLAKLGTTLEKRPVYQDVPMSYIKLKNKSITWKHWADEYHHHTNTAQWFKTLLPRLNDAALLYPLLL